MSDTETETAPPTRAQLEARLAEERRQEVEERNALAALAADPFPGDPDAGEPGEETETEAEAEVEVSPLDLIHRDYIAGVMEALGADALVVPCQSCRGYGFKPFELQTDPVAEGCPDCDGWGEVALPSHVAGQAKRMCGRCKGNGWIATASVTPLPAGDSQRPPAPPGFYYDPLGQLVQVPR